MKYPIIFILTIFLFACSESKEIKPYEKQSSRMIFTNAKVYTLDENQPWSDTLVFENGKIIYVGDASKVAEYTDESSMTIDLKGKFIIPGFVDSHTHPGLVSILTEEEGTSSEPLPKESKEALFAYLKKYASDNWYQPFIFLGGWDVNSFLPSGPTKEELDEIFGWRPVILLDNSGHSAWLNSMALWVLDIDKDTPDLSDNISYFVRDENGEPTGWIKEFAMYPYLGDLIVPTQEVMMKNMRDFLDFLSSKGVTSLWDAGNLLWDEQVYTVVSDLDKAGKLPLRYEGTYHVWQPDQLAIAVKKLKELRVKYEGPRLKFNTIKIHFDGVAEVLTAGMIDPYINTENRGGTLFSITELSKFILELNGEKIHLHLHSVGDRSTKEILDAVYLARAENNKPLDIRITLSHLETVAPEDIKRFEALDVHANFTPQWFSGEVFGQAGQVNLGPERAARSQVIAQFVEQGVNVTLSSDVVGGEEIHRANPFIGLQMSITRREVNSIKHKKTGDLQISPNGISLENALQSYSKNGAKQLGLEKEVGSISAGRKADFIILEKNIFEVNIDDIHLTKPSAVFVDGVMVVGEL